MRLLVSLALVLLPSLVSADDPVWQYWDFTIHITSVYQPEYQALLDTNVEAVWVVDLTTQPVEQQWNSGGLHRHMYVYSPLGPVTIYLPAIDEIWTYDDPAQMGRYTVALADDTFCTFEGPVYCAGWDIWHAFPDIVEIHAGRQTDGGVLKMPTIGAIASLWAGQGCLICGRVTDNTMLFSRLRPGPSGAAPVWAWAADPRSSTPPRIVRRSGRRRGACARSGPS
jgi:hypothetical protein